MSNRIEQYGDIVMDDEGYIIERIPTVIRCDCGAKLETIMGMDTSCERCHARYNASGQALRSDAPTFGANMDTVHDGYYESY